MESKKSAGRELSHREMWKQSHCRKGSRPLDNLSNLLVEDVDLEDIDLEGDIQEENLNWVDDRAPETLAKYEGYLVKKYGKEHSKHPKLDRELWSRAAGGKMKGKVYGLSNDCDPYVNGRQNAEIEKLNAVITEHVKEKEKERLNRIIEELVVEKEKDCWVWSLIWGSRPYWALHGLGLTWKLSY
ncbi:hypothetical protein L1987_74901 [Smallanthus sonchifolius]|uniref:Uncharacterized protein n=1 Tax=Smallanthus sonchifolius TaxID=185202 RepID=A0ACB9A3Y7_9ASTR|nr:hypothetical protein L1987_74901 [Smallanthus sonchifolius]